MKIHDIIARIPELNKNAKHAGAGSFYDGDCQKAVETLQKIQRLQQELRQRYDYDKLNELYRAIEG